MAKKGRSRKQKAATRKLIRFNKAKGRKKRKTRRKSSSKRKSSGKRRKANKKPKSKPSMAGRKGGKKKFIDKIPVLKNPTVQKIAFGLGIGLIAVKIIDFVAQVAPPALAAPLVQNKRIIQLGVEVATEPLSAVVDVATGGGFNLGSLTGRSNGGQNQVQSMGNGFA